MSSTKNKNPIQKESSEFLNRQVTGNSSGILVAFSGGPDSTALLAFLSDYSRDRGTPVAAAHFNHGLRGGPQAEKESTRVQKLAAEIGLPIFCGSAGEGEIYASALGDGVSVEEMARIYRYRFLRMCADDNGYTYIATGHTRDDLLETVIQRFFQGSGVAGLRGIPRSRKGILRPILTWSRDDVITFNKERKLTPFQDPSNAQDLYLRNQVRHTLLPAIEAVFPGFRRSIFTLSEKMNLTDDYLAYSMETELAWEPAGQGFSINGARFLQMHPLERVSAVTDGINRLGDEGGATRRLAYGGFKDLIVLPSMVNNRVLYRGGGAVVQVRNGMVFLEPDVVFGPEKGYFTVINEARSDGLAIRIDAPKMWVRRAVNRAGNGPCLPLEKIQFPLIIRSRRGGDAIKTAGSTKDLKKLYNEWNVTEQLRWRIAVCEDRNGIAAVIGSLLGYQDVRRPDMDTKRTGDVLAFARC